YGADVRLPASGFDAIDQALLSDPQTSGGLLVSCAPSAVDDVMALFARHGFAHAAVVGQVVQKAGERSGLHISN
ncbi:MAG: selenide, water dikinase SelD, partial [Burkholderiales bacterium]|nr:selenide, water dikinase SelD [Burkholderiales bacterium]